MEPLLAAIVALSVVATLAVLVAAVSVVVLARSARERQDAFLRAAVVTRATELANDPADLMPVVESLRPVISSPAHEFVSRKNGIVRERELDAMSFAHMDPDNSEDIEVFRAMKEAGLDPANPDDVQYWNEMGEL